MDRGSLFCVFKQQPGFELFGFYDRFCFARFVNKGCASLALDTVFPPGVSVEFAKVNYEVPHPQVNPCGIQRIHSVPLLHLAPRALVRPYLYFLLQPPDDDSHNAKILHVTHLPSKYNKGEMEKVFQHYPGFVDMRIPSSKYAYVVSSRKNYSTSPTPVVSFATEPQAACASQSLRACTNLVVTFARKGKGRVSDVDQNFNAEIHGYIHRPLHMPAPTRHGPVPPRLNIPPSSAQMLGGDHVIYRSPHSVGQPSAGYKHENEFDALNHGMASLNLQGPDRYERQDGYAHDDGADHVCGRRSAPINSAFTPFRPGAPSIPRPTRSTSAPDLYANGSVYSPTRNLHQQPLQRSHSSNMHNPQDRPTRVQNPASSNVFARDEWDGFHLSSYAQRAPPTPPHGRTSATHHRAYESAMTFPDREQAAKDNQYIEYLLGQISSPPLPSDLYHHSSVNIHPTSRSNVITPPSSGTSTPARHDHHDASTEWRIIARDLENYVDGIETPDRNKRGVDVGRRHAGAGGGLVQGDDTGIESLWKNPLLFAGEQTYPTGRT
ncbi:hypothetical protein BDK51DRAFT_47265 [Blyttiomyces helicus]|uniref:RRM domain-containing protein n=1 Tax=Blyttiomyces helicus TaxID=388810 RepID=A0A4V1IS18_9FUNG|nr:hypothetical protein BDK51DRAFT_47265 [Blyttiomyces helicus]|eukprot:RKO92007.1 hypothetical protein BDK51DRAFT_47265 [Blyttiomyces helicus]